jgi:hypothetical protein
VEDGRVSEFEPELTQLERAGVNKDACCYSWVSPCPGGRPLSVEGAPRLASVATEASRRASVSALGLGGHGRGS